MWYWPIQVELCAFAGIFRPDARNSIAEDWR